MGENEPQLTGKVFAQSILSDFPCLPNISKSIALSAVPPSKILLSAWVGSTEEHDVLIVSALASMAHYSVFDKKACFIFCNKLKRAIAVIGDARVKNAVMELVKDSKSIEKTMCFISVLSKVSNVDITDIFLDLFSKVCLISKTRPIDAVMRSCDMVFSLVTHDQFNASLLPNIKKGLLRNPEIAIYGVNCALRNISLPLDLFAEDIAKAISTSLASSEPDVQLTAVDVLCSVITHTTDLVIIKKLIGRLFDQVSASKSPEQRITVLNGIADCSSRVQTSPDIEKIAVDVISRTAKAEKETNENVISANWECAQSWVNHLGSYDHIYGMLKEASKLSPAVRCIGYRTLCNIINQRGLETLPADMQTSLYKEFENSQKEGLDAIGLFFLVLRTTAVSSEQYAIIWNKIAANETVFKEKSIASLRWKDAIIWADLLKYLLLNSPHGTSPFSSSVILRSLALLLFWPQWNVRKNSLNVLEQSMKLWNAELAESLADVVYIETVNGTIGNLLRKSNCCPDSTKWHVPGEWYISVLRKLLAVDGNNKEEVAIHTLLLASLPRLVQIDGSVWLRWLHEQENSQFTQTDEFVSTALRKVMNCNEKDVRDNSLITLSALNIQSVKSALWLHVEKRLEIVDLKAYSKISEKEVAIWKCPTGQLYNTDVLDIDEGALTANMKRENKAYSFQEQLQEQQLRRELAEKKRKEGKLTAKQKQAMEKELANEKLIRDQLDELYNICAKPLDELRAMVVADPHGALSRSEILFAYCIPLTRSHLVANEAAELFFAYRDATFPPSEDYLHDLLGSTWLRVIGSKYSVANWSDEPLSDALSRTLALLNERAFVIDTGDEDDDLCVFDEIVGAPQLTLLYPMLKLVLSGSYSEKLKEDVLKLLQSAIHKRFLKDGAVLQLPTLEYSDLLLSHYTDSLSPSCLQALVNLFSLANETESAGKRVILLVRGALRHLDSAIPDVRENVIKVLSAPQLLTRLVLSCEDEHFVLECLTRLLIARFDGIESVSDSASILWDASHLHLRKSLLEHLILECTSPKAHIREPAAFAMKEYTSEFPEEMSTVLQRLDETYKSLFELKPAVYDSVGRMQSDICDEWEKRSGIGLAIQQLTSIVTADNAEQLVRIVVPLGLQDRKDVCRQVMCAAGVDTIRHHGSIILPSMLPFLEQLTDNTPAGAEHDSMRQGLVVLLGTLAQFLEPSSPKVRSIVGRLMDLLSTPSQPVQESVCRCIVPLVPSVRESCKQLGVRLIHLLFNADTYGERRGAAYGVAAFVEGMGMTSLKDFDLISTITKALAEKKNWKQREGALLGLEILCSTIGKLFEPYIIKQLPAMLLSFGDNEENVRRAAEDTARAMMSSMSSYGTRLILPSLSSALDDDSWRTKCAATELLGSMAFCAPRQLSACLPNIVPKLTEVLADSSAKVQKSGEKALRQIARVIRNPEILGVSNQLMAGLLDPANRTSVALTAVMNTKFIHYIDPPSIALLMPVIKRAFEDRNSESRRSAAQIIANIYNLTEEKDMEPYLTDLVPGLQKSLMDPLPEIRSVSARALGSIISRSTGKTSEEIRSTIIPWLKAKLISPQSTVDRSGAAQGLCEVLAGIGTEQLDLAMPEIIAITESTEICSETRDGYILMYIYLPMTFGERFVPYLPQVVPPILKALADENEYVRASALKAGQRLISQYCAHARRLLLPQLQLALMDDNWRIRYASVQLIGDFLFNISGVTGKSSSATANDDDTMGMEQAGKTIVRALGQQSRDRVLAGLYLARSDVALVVRQAAGHVWKIVVSNTPRTLKEVMKVLFEMVVDSLASSCEERQQMGARCLGELVRKMGDKIINEILPVLEINQQSEDVAKRVGVAVALHEIIDNMSKEVLNHYLDMLVPPVRAAICDNEFAVRMAAADTFSVLYQNVGNEALDEIITPLLEKLTPEQDHILEGLCEVMKRNSRSMLPYLLPRLTKPPVNVHALCSLAAVSGDSLSRQLPRVLDALLASCKTNDQYDEMIDPCERVVIAVADEEGIPVLSDYLLKNAAKGNVPSAVLLHSFVDKSGAPLSELAETFLPELLQLYISDNSQIVDHVVHAAIGVAQALDQREMQDILPHIKKSLNIVVSQAKGKQIPGFTHPKSLQPLLPMLREGILQGGIELKALAGETLGLLVAVSEKAALQTHVVSITGPLIRVLGDRYPPNVKLAILDTLSRLLEKVSMMMKPFLPQLQSTFVKALQEPSSRPVRLAAAGALARLLPIHPKPEPLVVELFKLLGNCQDLLLMETTFVAARALVAGCASKLSQTTIQEGYHVCELLYSQSLENPSEMDSSLTMCSGALLGEIIIRTEDFKAQDIFQDIESSSKIRVRQAKMFALQQMCYSDAEKVWSEAHNETRSALVAAFSSDPVIACSAVRSAAHILISEGCSPDRDLLSALARSINHQSIDVRRTTASALGHVFQKAPSPLPNDILKLAVPQLVNGTKESNSSVRCASELALVYAFHIISGEEVFDAYRSSVEGSAKGILDEVHVSLRRAVKHGDISLEGLYNITAV